MITLRRGHLAIYKENTRSAKDARKKIALAVFEYFDEATGDDYRKSFSAKPYTSEVEFYEIAPKIIKQ